ncbi:VC0807 family protein [Actinomadura hibisca]|uniref:VC0807 family protein n=1 Tax=Actinomadura hibisca TaxID=68565 RepID=UPI000AEFDEF7|nr:VC0807 family protein [Actinomadura hibisca]
MDLTATLPALPPASASAPAPTGTDTTADAAGHCAFEMPRLTAMLRHALPRFVEGVIAPVAVFYAAFALLGLNGGLAAAVTWVYGGILWRRLRGHAVSAMLVLAALGVTVRAGLAAVTHSAVVYFLQPTLGTLLVAMTFLASVPLGRPLAQKVATDMVPMPEAFLRHDRVRRFFLRISLLWSLVFFVNAALSLWMLFSQSIGVYLWVRTGLVAALGAVAVVVSVWGFRRCLHHVNAAGAGNGGTVVGAAPA